VIATYDADGLCGWDSDRENKARVIAEYETIEFEESLRIQTGTSN